MRVKTIAIRRFVLLGLLVLAVPATAQTPSGDSVPDLDALERQIEAAKAALRALEAEGMVVIPAGRFTMGSTPGETSRENVPDQIARREHPQHEVRVRSFALAKYDVTRNEYADFVHATGHEGTGCYSWDGQKLSSSETADWRSPGFSQTDRDPVVCVSHDDAEAYISWYSAKTGHAYRLPTEAEWENAARAGTVTARFWGDDAANQCGYANGADQTAARQFPKWTVAGCSDGYMFTSPVRTFQPNAWGLYDMLGNVFQWTDDCWNESYAGAPTDGSAWTSGDCGKRVVRGGAWATKPTGLRSAARNWDSTGFRDVALGFRLARTLP